MFVRVCNLLGWIKLFIKTNDFGFLYYKFSFNLEDRIRFLETFLKVSIEYTLNYKLGVYYTLIFQRCNVFVKKKNNNNHNKESNKFISNLPASI